MAHPRIVKSQRVTARSQCEIPLTSSLLFPRKETETLMTSTAASTAAPQTSESYFRRISATRFEASRLTAGAWNVTEQHISPVIGLLTHLVISEHEHRRGPELGLASISCDILGVIPVGEFDVDVRLVRPGRTIELIEATLSHSGRTAVVLRGWMLQRSDTHSLSATTLPGIRSADQMQPYAYAENWNGEFVRSIEVRRDYLAPGRARGWVRKSIPLLEGETISQKADFSTILDIANGLSPLADPREVAFPNLDLQATYFRDPEGEWLGLDTSVSFGPGGVGLTETVLHDLHGPVGTLTQTLTVRS